MAVFWRKVIVLPWCLLLGILLNPRAVASEADALAISANIQAKHLPFGTVLDPIYASASSDQITGYTRCGDSAIWTGHYLAAEAFRYGVTGSPDALANAKGAVAGLKLLADVTGTNLLARCLAPKNSPFAAGIASEEKANGIYTNSSAGYIWVGNTSRDQFVGAFFGLAVAYDQITDAPTRAAIADLVTRFVGFLSGHGWNIAMPDGSVSTTFLLRPDELLMLMQVAEHVNPSALSAADKLMRPALVGAMGIPITVDTLSNSSYFKFNLDYITLYNLIRLESGDALSVYRQAYSVLRNYTAAHQNAFFDTIDLGLNGVDQQRDRETTALLDEWLLRRRRDQYVDNTSLVKVCGSEACAPILVPMRSPTDFLWQRDPFQLYGGGQGQIESAGIDYILPYWMSRYYGLTTPFVVQSAAAASSAVAPDSLASLYGSNVASETAQAASLPLPTELGGVSLTITDASGRSVAAPLGYVSPGQINFSVPSGLAPGQATFTLSNAGVPSAAAGVLWPVVPRLFTANGSGLAAASAVEINSLTPKIQTPVDVTRCDSSGCVPVNIALDAGSTVYLSLYGSGIRNRSALSDVSVTVNGIGVPLLFAGPQTQFPGLDQVNIELPSSLKGAGLSNIVLTIAGQNSNPVAVSIE